METTDDIVKLQAEIEELKRTLAQKEAQLLSLKKKDVIICIHDVCVRGISCGYLLG